MTNAFPSPKTTPPSKPSLQAYSTCSGHELECSTLMTLVYRNGRPRLQRSVRRGGRVTTEYRGSGEVALLIAQLETIERDERDMQRFEGEAERKALEGVEEPLNEYFDRVEDLVRSALYAAGYHRPKREWRRCRER